MGSICWPQRPQANCRHYAAHGHFSNSVWWEFCISDRLARWWRGHSTEQRQRRVVPVAKVDRSSLEKAVYRGCLERLLRQLIFVDRWMGYDALALFRTVRHRRSKFQERQTTLLLLLCIRCTSHRCFHAMSCVLQGLLKSLTWPRQWARSQSLLPLHPLPPNRSQTWSNTAGYVILSERSQHTCSDKTLASMGGGMSQGNETTAMGRKRVADGHPAKYQLKYIEL